MSAAFNPYSSPRPAGRPANNGYNQQNGSYNRPNNFQSRGPAPVQEITAEAVPVDYVEAAETIMSEIMSERNAITTSKIRKILAMIMDVYNTESLRSEKEITAESTAKLQMMRVRTIYECGRDPATKIFCNRAKVLNYLKGVGKDRDMVIRFTYYLEALVAFHRFFGGREG